MGERLYPLKFYEIFKERPWGSDGLRTYCGKNAPDGVRIGESWEIADLGEDISRVKEGALSGATLRELCAQFPDVMIGKGKKSGRFPLLFKLLSTAEALSVQVHPDDAYAARQHPGGCGKIEAWHILHAGPDSWIILGFNRLTDRVEVEELLAAERIGDILHRIPVRAGETYLIQPGMVHAIGPHIILAEIQQSSDLTYRLYDWGRVGLDGKPRPLHVADALNVLKCREPRPSRVAPKDISVNDHVQWQKLVECEAFAFERVTVEREEAFLPPQDFSRILHVIVGEGIVRQPSTLFRRRPSVSIRKGDSVLLPASADGFVLEPRERLELLLADHSPMLGG